MDRLEEIKVLYHIGAANSMVHADISWLISEVERLRAREDEAKTTMQSFGHLCLTHKHLPCPACAAAKWLKA